MKFSIFQSEATGAALRGWAKAAKKKHNEPNHVHTPPGTPHDSNTTHDLSYDSSIDSSTTSSTPSSTTTGSQGSRLHVHEPHDLGHLKPHIGILGLTKALDEHGRPVDIPAGVKLHGTNEQAHGNGIPHHGHPHALQTHGMFV